MRGFKLSMRNNATSGEKASKAKVVAVAVAVAVEWALAFAFTRHFAKAVADANWQLANAEYNHMHYLYDRTGKDLAVFTGRGYPAPPDNGRPFSSVPDWSREVPTDDE